MKRPRKLSQAQSYIRLAAKAIKAGNRRDYEKYDAKAQQFFRSYRADQAERQKLKAATAHLPKRPLDDCPDL